MSERPFPFGQEPVDLAPPPSPAPPSRTEETAPVADLLPPESVLPFSVAPPSMPTQRIPVTPPERAVEVAPRRMPFETAAALVLLGLDVVAIAIAIWGR